MTKSLMSVNQGGTGAATAAAARTALSAASTAANTFTASQTFNTALKGVVTGGTVTFNFSETNVQKLTVGGALTIALSGFPATSIYSDILIEITNGGSAVLTFPTISWILPTTGAAAASFSAYLTAIGRSPASLQTAGVDYIYLWTTTAGGVVYGKII